MLCNACQTWFGKASSIKTPKIRDPWFVDVLWNDLRDLEASVQRGCQLCTMVFYAIKNSWTRSPSVVQASNSDFVAQAFATTLITVLRLNASSKEPLNKAYGELQVCLCHAYFLRTLRSTDFVSPDSWEIIGWIYRRSDRATRSLLRSCGDIKDIDTGSDAAFAMIRSK
jgi:hypothetical protein